MKTQFFARASAAALGTALCVIASPAPAQTEPTATGQDEGDVIVVTGSFIRGTPEDAALPVDVFSSEDLEQNGVSSPLEFIKDLPSVGAVLGDSNQFSTAAQGFQGSGSINLRGLGPTRTLVLFNGRRTMQSPGDGFTDTQLIPLFALDRVEILKDGAAATYGSDAIAGVANFVTRQGFEGFEVQGDYEFVDGSDGNWTMSALAGFQWGDLNLMAGVGWQHRSELGTLERDFTREPYTVNPSGYSALGSPGLYAVTYLDIDPVTFQVTGSDTRFAPEPGCTALGGTPGSTSGLPICRFTYVPFDNLVEEEDRYQAYIQADVDLSDRLRFFAEGLYAKTDLESLAYSPAFPPTQGPLGSGSVSAFTVSPNNPGVPAFLNSLGLPASTPLAPIFRITSVLARPFGYTGNPLDPERGAGRGLAKNEGWRIAGGFDYDFADTFRGQLYGTYWRMEREAFAPGIVGSRYQAALNGLGGPNCVGTVPGQNGCQYFNPFVNAGPTNPALDIANPQYVPGNDNDPALVSWFQVPNGTFQTEQQFVLDLVFSGELGVDLGGGPIAYAFGAQYRENDYTSDPLRPESNLDLNPCFIEGDLSCVGTPTEGVGSFIFLGGTRPVQLSQDVYALFAEVNIPIGNTLEVTGAIRYEDYGGSVGSTVNPKGSIRWEPTDWLVLRGSVGTTFRGPLATQVAPNSVTTLAGIQAANNNFKSVDIFGNPNDLGPETAFTYNIGVIVDYGGFTGSIDYWSYDFDDRITTTPGQAIASAVVPVPGGLADCSSPVVDLVTFQGGCVQGVTVGTDISRVRTDWVNGPSVKTSGFDFALDYTTDLGTGVFSIGGQATHVLEYEFDDFIFRGINVQPGYDAAGFANFFRDPNTVSEWRANGYVNYNISGLNLRYTIQYIDGVTDDRCVNVNPCATTEFGPTNFGARVPSYTQHDVHVAYDLPLDFVDATLQFSIENFTDEDPSEARLELGYNPFIGNPLGRIYRLGARLRF